MLLKMKKMNVRLFLFTLLIVGLSSCTSYKKVPYLKNNLDKNTMVLTLPSLIRDSEVRYMVGDALGITVNSNIESSLVADFNLPFQPLAATENVSDLDVPQGQGRQTYLVNKEGFIDFPILGQIHVEGLTRDELEQELKTMLKKYLKMDPVVTIRLLNYRITVIGEVNSPGIYPITRDHINVLEALALAGDMTIYGRRDNVLICREMPGQEEMKIIRLNLNDSWIISSPDFYLQQNDMIYVEPNKTRAQNADVGAQANLWFSFTSVVLSAATLIMLFVKQ